jgi:hypothetical protein
MYGIPLMPPRRWRRLDSMNVVQAVNRFRCRKVTNGRGGCPQFTVNILLPFYSQSDRLVTETAYILDAIKAEMPGIRLKDINGNLLPWGFELNGPRALIKRGSVPDKLVAYLESIDRPGTTVNKDTMRNSGVLKFSAKQIERVFASLQEPGSALSKSVDMIGWRYVKGVSRSNPSRLEKIPRQ